MTRNKILFAVFVLLMTSFACANDNKNEVLKKWINNLENDHHIKIADQFELLRSETIPYYNEEIPNWADVKTSDIPRYSPDRKYIYQVHGSIFSMDSGTSIFDIINNRYLLSIGGGDFTEFDYADWINKNQIIVMGTEYDFDLRLWMPWYCIITLNESDYKEDLYFSKVGFNYS